ncbi:hypothetical protein [Edaphocola aurantiacus]|uniref:hypothetical protein n=1 Tax=Edaphocola aurantiacus TaxID=2601682 RepID=UPI001C96ACAF|nr:hypothetical protein [Edaphocola aurantiacus]
MARKTKTERKAARQEKKATRQAARQQKKADRANGIKPKSGIGGILGGNKSSSSSSGGFSVGKFGAKIGLASLSNSNAEPQNFAASLSEKKSTGEIIQNTAETVGAVGGLIGDVIGKVRGIAGGGGSGEGAGEYEESDVPGNPGGAGIGGWLKQNWYIPVGVLVVGVGIYMFTRKSPK